jgi:hypothetical protein
MKIGSEKIDKISGCLWSPITGSFLPSKKSAWERDICSPPKTRRKRQAQGDAVVRLTLFTTMEGLPAGYF